MLAAHADTIRYVLRNGLAPWLEELCRAQQPCMALHANMSALALMPALLLSCYEYPMKVSSAEARARASRLRLLSGLSDMKLISSYVLQEEWELEAQCWTLWRCMTQLLTNGLLLAACPTPSQTLLAPS